MNRLRRFFPQAVVFASQFAVGLLFALKRMAARCVLACGILGFGNDVNLFQRTALLVFAMKSALIDVAANVSPGYFLLLRHDGSPFCL
jgi:hypothetical protein